MSQDSIMRILCFLLVIFLFLEIILFTSIQYEISNEYYLLAVMLLIFLLQVYILYPLRKDIISVIDSIFYKIHKEFLSLLNHGFKIFLLYVLLSSLLISYLLGISLEGIITTHDYPRHYYLAWYTTTYLIPIFHNAIGWSPFSYAGYPIGYSYMTGMSILIALLNTLPGGIITFTRAYNIYLILALIVTPISTYILMQKFGFNKNYCNIAGLISVIPTLWYPRVGYYHAFIPLIFATGISPLVFAYFHEYFQKKSSSSLLISALIFAMVILTHYLVAIAVLCGLFIYLSLRLNKINVRNKIAIIAYFIITFLLSAFVVIPTIFYIITGYIGVPPDFDQYRIVKNFMDLIDLHAAFLLTIPIPAWFFFYGGYKKGYKDNNDFNQKSSVKFILAYLIALYVYTFYTAFPFSPLRDANVPIHLMGYLGVYTLLLISIGLSNYIATRPFLGYFAFFTLFIILLNPPLFMVLQLVYPIENIVISQMIYPVKGTILSTGLTEEQIGIFNWIKENADPDTRVLVELNDYPHISTPPWTQGHVSSLLPIFVGNNIKFIGMYSTYASVPYSSTASTAKGVFFRIPIENISTANYTKFMQRLNEFNIQYILTWSNESKIFFNSSNRDFVFVESIGNVTVYEYKYSPHSFIVRINGSANAEVTDFGIKTITLNVTANDTAKITVSSAYFPNWHAYIMPDKKEVPIGKDDMFIQITVPMKENPYSVEIIFEETALERYSKILSISTWLIIIVSIISLRFYDKTGI